MMQPDTTKGYQLSFKVFHAGALTREDKLSVDSVTIGRADSNVIALDDERVSDVHAVVKVTKDRKLLLTDLGSDEGTYVGDERVDTRVQLQPSSRIRVGPFDIHLELVDTSPRVAPPPPPPEASAQEEDKAVRERTNTLLDLSAADVTRLLFDAWDSKDKLGVDNKQVPRVLEIFEIWGDTILSARQFPRTVQSVTLADEHKLKPDFFIDHEYLPTSPCSLIAQEGGVPQLCFGEKFQGSLFRGSKETPLPELISRGEAKRNGAMYQVPLTDDSRFVVKLEHIVLVGAFSYPAKKPVGVGAFDVDTTLMSLLLIIGILFGSGAVYMRMLPPPKELDISEIPDRFVKLIIPEKVEKKPEPKKIEVQPQKRKEEQPPPPKEVEDRGKKDSKIQPKKADKVALDQAAEDKKAAERALAGLIGNSGLDRGFGPDVSKAAAGLLATTGVSNVTGVSGSRGLGFSGGEGAGGIGNLGTKGGSDGGYGSEVAYKGRKKATADINIGGDDTIVLGALDKSIIDKVIRDHLTQIRYCYQRELPRNPRLTGKIVVKFTIDKTGSVSQSNVKETSMANPSVEGCINQRMQGLKFPEPKGGGMVIVVYPFFFKAAG